MRPVASIPCAAALAIGMVMAVCAGARAEAPPQRLPSAVLIYPLIQVEGGGATVDTRVELVNLTRRAVDLKCIYVPARTCSGLDFHVRLTANQPLSWLASQGLFNTTSSTAVPPFSSSGELKCIVQPDDEGVDRHNAIQGRAAVFGADGQTIGYSAVGFLRLVNGPLENLISLDGITYSQCPDEQHFVFQSSGGGPASQSEIIIAPCSEDLENLVAPPTAVQFEIINEFEQHLSASTIVTCYARRTLLQISSSFSSATLGSETGHVIVKGVQTPVLAMLVDRFVTPDGAPATAGNEPALRGGRAAEIRFP
ncbi:MAG: hypothetical protein U0802_01180 [Candidatus Binatia bacterium]